MSNKLFLDSFCFGGLFFWCINCRLMEDMNICLLGVNLQQKKMFVSCACFRDDLLTCFRVIVIVILGRSGVFFVLYSSCFLRVCRVLRGYG